MDNYKTEAVDKCPVCGGKGEHDGTSDETEFDDVALIYTYSCNDCGTAYHNPRMTSATMKEYYSSGIYRKKHPTSDGHEHQRATRILSLFQMYPEIRPKRCLDVGSSKGHLMKQLKNTYNAEVVGLDWYVDPKAVIKPFTDKEDITGKFDLITCIHTLEHFNDPVAELEWMADLLTEDGTLVIEIPTMKEVTPPHPTIFSNDAVSILMEHIGLGYDTLNVAIQVSVIIASKKKKAQPNDAEFYDDIYRTRPGKWASVQRDIFALKALQEYKPKSMLDFGCGNGHTLDYFRTQWPKTKYTGVDISEVALKLAQWHVRDGKFFTSMPSRGKWNIITVMGVAEHFENPVAQLREIGKRLTKNGKLYLEVPNCLVDSDTEGFRQTSLHNGNGAGQHEWHWTRSSWEKTIVEANFDIMQRYTGDELAWEFVWILKYKGD